LVGVLRPVIEVAVLARFDPRTELALGGSVALEVVGHEHARHVGQSLEQLAEELLGRFLIPAALHQDIPHGPVLIHRPPEVLTLALNRQKPLLHLPLVPRPRPAATELIGIVLAKFATPLAKGLVSHHHAPFQEEFFHIAEAQTDSDVQPPGVADDLDRKPMVLLAVGWGCGVHATTLSHCVGVQQVDNAMHRE
jgi:hypothetical protein